MFLVIALTTIVLGAAAWWAAYKAAHRYAQPTPSKFAGSMAGLASLPFLLGAMALTGFTVGAKLAIPVCIVIFVGTIIFSVKGEMARNAE